MRRALSRQSPAGFRALLRSLPWLLAALLPGPLACSPAGPGADVWPPGSADDIPALRERDDLNLVFVVVDTLRADHLGAYGYERDTSPVMDWLMERGIRFERVRAQSSWTKASMASLWTAAYPATTGVQRYSDALGEAAVMPAETLREAGFVTGGVFRNGWVAENFGFAQGFDLYVRPSPSRDPARFAGADPLAQALPGTDLDATEAALEFLRTHRDQRFFLYVHYMDVHQYLYEIESAHFGTRLVDAYDNAIHWTDRNLALLFAELQELDLVGRTLLVLASDHGESFREHGQEGHARHLYAEVTRVPFAIALPFRLPQPIVVEPWVRNIDVWPTLFDLLGIPAPAGEGRSLLPLVEAAAAGRDPAPLAPETTLAFLDRTWGRPRARPRPLVSLTAWPHRILVSPDGSRDSELFDLASDPREQRDLAASRPELRARLEARVDAALAKGPRRGLAVEVELDDLRLQQLRALGYVVPRPE